MWKKGWVTGAILMHRFHRFHHHEISIDVAVSTRHGQRRRLSGALGGYDPDILFSYRSKGGIHHACACDSGATLVSRALRPLKHEDRPEPWCWRFPDGSLAVALLPPNIDVECPDDAFMAIHAGNKSERRS